MNFNELILKNTRRQLLSEVHNVLDCKNISVYRLCIYISISMTLSNSRVQHSGNYLFPSFRIIIYSERDRETGGGGLQTSRTRGLDISKRYEIRYNI